MKLSIKAIIILLTLPLSSCSDLATLVNNQDTVALVNSEKNKELDVTKVVDIQILNPSNKSTVEWYKKDEKNIVMKIGSQANLIGTAELKDGTKSSNVAWSSSDNTIVVVKDGKISANKLGVTTILATSVLDSTYKGLINIEVVDDANFSTSDRQSINNVKSININTLGDHGDKFEWFNTGDTIKAKSNVNISAIATVTLSDNTKNSNVIWESSDNNIASVDDKGKIVTKSPGTTTVIAKYRLNPDFKGIINVSVEGENSNMGNSPQNNSETSKISSIIFEEGFENGLDKWFTDKNDFKCIDFSREIFDFPVNWKNSVYMRVKSGVAKEGNKYLVSTSPDGEIPSNSKVLFNIIKTKEPIDFSSLKSPTLQLYVKSTAIPYESVKFSLYISSKPAIVGGSGYKGSSGSLASCAFGSKYDDLSYIREHLFGTDNGIADLTYKISPYFSSQNKDWEKKDFDLSGSPIKAGYLLISISIENNITKFEGPMIDAIKIYDAE